MQSYVEGGSFDRHLELFKMISISGHIRCSIAGSMVGISWHFTIWVDLGECGAQTHSVVWSHQHLRSDTSYLGAWSIGITTLCGLRPSDGVRLLRWGGVME